MFTWLFNLYNKFINNNIIKFSDYLDRHLDKYDIRKFHKYNGFHNLYKKLMNDNITEFIDYLDTCLDKYCIREFYKNNDKNIKIYVTHGNILCSFSPNDGIRKYDIEEIEFLIKYGFFRDGTKIPFVMNGNEFGCVFTSVKQFIKSRYHMNIPSLLFDEEYFISDKLFEYYNNYILTNDYDKNYITALRNKDYLELNMHKLSNELYTRSNRSYITISEYSLYLLEMSIYENNKELINKLKSLQFELHPLIQKAINYQDETNEVSPIIKSKSIKYFDILSQKMDKFDNTSFKNQIAADIFVLILMFNE